MRLLSTPPVAISRTCDVSPAPTPTAPGTKTLPARLLPKACCDAASSAGPTLHDASRASVAQRVLIGGRLCEDRSLSAEPSLHHASMNVFRTRTIVADREARLGVSSRGGGSGLVAGGGG